MSFPGIFNTVYAVGTDPTYYYTRSGMSVSYNSGATWQPLSPVPFDVHEGIQDWGDNIYNWLVISNVGGAVISTNTDDATLTWGTPYKFTSPTMQITQLSANVFGAGFLAVGWQTNPTQLTEQAVVSFTAQGTDAYSWQIKYVHPDHDSGLWAMTLDPNTSDVFAVGWQKNNHGLLLWSGDSGESWREIPVPPELDAPFYSVTGTRERLLVGTRGRVLSMTWDGATAQFKSSAPMLDSQGRAKAVTFIHDNFDQNQPMQTVALSGDQVFYSPNGFDYQSVRSAGYTFTTGVYVAGRWIFGCESLLNQYTGFYGEFVYDPDLRLVLTGYHNGVHAKRFIVR